MNELVTMIIIAITGAGGITVDTSETTLSQCNKVSEVLRNRSDESLFFSKSKQYEVKCILKGIQ